MDTTRPVPIPSPRPRKRCKVCKGSKHLDQFGSQGKSDTCIQCAIREEHANKGWYKSGWNR